MQESHTGNSENSGNTEPKTVEQDSKKKTLTLGLGKKLELKKPTDGQVQQSFTHGRTKTVEVEVENFLGKSKKFEQALEEYLATLNSDN